MSPRTAHAGVPRAGRRPLRRGRCTAGEVGRAGRARLAERASQPSAGHGPRKQSPWPLCQRHPVSTGAGRNPPLPGHVGATGRGPTSARQGPVAPDIAPFPVLAAEPVSPRRVACLRTCAPSYSPGHRCVKFCVLNRVRRQPPLTAVALASGPPDGLTGFFAGEGPRVRQRRVCLHIPNLRGGGSCCVWATGPHDANTSYSRSPRNITQKVQGSGVP